MYLWQTYWIDPAHPPQRLGARVWYVINDQWVGGWTLAGEWSEAAYLSGRSDDLEELGRALSNAAAQHGAQGAALLTFGTRISPFRMAYDRLFWVQPEYVAARYDYGLPRPGVRV